MTGIEQPVMKVNFVISYADNPNQAPGFYWQMEVAEGHYGPAHGPFVTKQAAHDAAGDFIAGEIERLAGKSAQRIKLP